MAATTEGSRMVRIGAWAALVAGAALVIKVAHIFATDGAEHALHGVLYLGGILLAILGAAGVGALYGSTPLKKIGFGVLSFVGFLFFMMVVSDAVGGMISAVVEAPGYVSDELPIALAGLVWLVVGYRLLNNGDRGSRTA